MENTERKKKVSKRLARKEEKILDNKKSIYGQSQTETDAFKNADQQVKEQIKANSFVDYNAPSASANGKETNWAKNVGELERIAGPNAGKMGFTTEHVEGSDFRQKVKQPEFMDNISKATLKLPQGAVQEKINTLATKDTDSSVGKAVTPVEEKPKTFSDYLAEQRKNLTKEKTDAAKMQKYYALTDALGAIGKMGGAAIGGAIGGNVLDSAPKVEDYKESRGYLDAFEKAKQANDRLRKLDETEFQLSYNKQQRDEERAYKAEQDRIAREYSAAQAELNRQWQAEQQRITREWNQAVADKDFARQAELKKELTKMEQDFKLKYQKIANAHDTAIKNISKEIVNIQNSGGKKVPIGFKNGTGITVPKAYYDDMLEFFIGDDWDGHKVTKDNVKTYIRNHPDKVNAYLSMFGLGTSAETKTETTEETPNNEEVTPNNAPNFFYYNPITDSTIKSEFPLAGMEESSEYPNENKVRQVPAKKAAEANATTEEEDELNAYLAQFE